MAWSVVIKFELYNHVQSSKCLFYFLNKLREVAIQMTYTVIGTYKDLLLNDYYIPRGQSSV